ncbi:Pantothenate synthetase [Gemmatirosa kalamazoonensis]|uniref:Pantothenate synthetase n=1 Tax=Gemmatirosa kalamazoonensis TaxID=861299 RepID=W0RG68_9BACT|nr:pantoate--beta-alanine ligase [Gemmatirosa kalamazoonensis]AHG89432.1 Pantothenate synthetase [Gemmatirosa kalamazoonensis]
MRIVRTVAELRALLDDERRAGRTVGLVPTMGYFHEGHASLMRRARDACDVVVVSLFVNPTQFDDPADLVAYPRDEARDASVAAVAGVAYLFAPEPAEIYPPGFATSVTVARVTEPMEGAQRGPGHFRGVATVVAKLFNIVQPHAAFFGQKDAQQALVVRRMARDLDFRLRVEVCPTVREPDGLAMSSRNVRLDADARRRAVALARGLEAARSRVLDGATNAVDVVATGRDAMRALDVEPEYFEVVSADTLEPVDPLAGELLVAVAARVGGVRLIDNVLVDAGAR